MAGDAPDEENQPHVFNPKGVNPPQQIYSHVAVTPLLSTSKLITLAGQIGQLPSEWGYKPPTIKEQAPIAYSNIETCLTEAQATLRDIVHVRHYIVEKTGDPKTDELDLVDRGWVELWKDFMEKRTGGYRPPDTVVGVASLARKGILYECEVTAIVHTKSSA